MANEIFKKYEFSSELEAEAIIAGLPSATDEEGNSYPTHKHSVVRLGYLWTTEPTFDEEGNVVTPGVQSDKYSVDVLWDGNSLLVDEEIVYPDGWEDAEIQYDPSWQSKNGYHTFGGWNFS
jgi:hypothetical protein